MVDDERRRLFQLKRNLELRADIFNLTRSFFRDKGFLEVETPVRMSVLIPEAHIAPFESEDWYLSTSPELYMKKLLASGYKSIFQFSRCFRKGERGRWHNPEFTMLEWYASGSNYLTMIEDTEQLVLALAQSITGGSVIKYLGGDIDITPPWPRISVHDAFVTGVGWDPVGEPDLQKFDTDLVSSIVPGFDLHRPTVLMDYPASMASLARLKPGHPEIAERAEVFIGGLEIANAYSELRDSYEQEKRFHLELENIGKLRGQKSSLPSSFLDAIACLPECGGIALGMDRLVMLFCNAGKIEDVIAFPSEKA